MPCKFHSGDYRCDFGFNEGELEGARCALHSDPNEQASWSEARLALIQGALNIAVQRATQKSRPLNLIGVVLPKNVSFGTKDLPEINAQDSHFGGGRHFESAIFSASTNFSRCQFRDGTSFSGSHFKGDVKITETQTVGMDFSRAIFDRGVHLQIGGNKGTVDLSETKCAGDVLLATLNRLHTKIVCKRAAISGRLHCEGQFKADIDLSGTHVVGGLSLAGSLSGALIAHSCVFDGVVRFPRMKFAAGLDLTGTTFRSPSRFDCIFESRAVFASCIFDKTADFSASDGLNEKENTFAEIRFHDVVFRDAVVFTNRTFSSTTSFSGCEFSVAPAFHGARLHQDTRFPRIEAFRDVGSEDAAAAYRSLRQAMEANNARREEAMFYALEQRTLRNIPGAQTRWENFASAFYDAVSGYGVNFWRPMGWLTTAMIIFGIAYAFWMSWPIDPSSSFDVHRFNAGQVFSVQQIVNPFWIWRAEELPWPAESPNAVKLVATIQSLLTTGLFALSLLALRWRFKRE